MGNHAEPPVDERTRRRFAGCADIRRVPHRRPQPEGADRGTGRTPADGAEEQHRGHAAPGQEAVCDVDLRGAGNNRRTRMTGCARGFGRERMAVNSVLVYRLDTKTKAMIPLGILVERRESERGDNVIAMLRMARREFAATEKEAADIFIKYEAGTADAV